jgi:hypothetical protein
MTDEEFAEGDVTHDPCAGVLARHHDRFLAGRNTHFCQHSRPRHSFGDAKVVEITVRDGHTATKKDSEYANCYFF